MATWSISEYGNQQILWTRYQWAGTLQWIKWIEGVLEYTRSQKDIDDSYLYDSKRSAQKSLDDNIKAQEKKDKETQKKAEFIFIQDKKEIVKQLAELQKDPVANSWSIQSMIDLLDKKSISELDQWKRDLILERAKTETVSPTIAPQPGVPAPIRAEQPWATPVAWGGNAPVKNAANQYTFADSHKEFDSTAIPTKLNKWKIRPVDYFNQNGLNWLKDSKRIANEMGMADYRWTPGQNYALVEYMENKKNWTLPGQEPWKDATRKFDGIQSDVLPNRFTQEERDRVMAMTPDEQKQYVSKRNMEDLKKMLPWNIGLINKVFGTNYTSDDINGGVGRATIMGTNMTAKGMEVQKLIDSLRPGQADKFMNKGGELDNAVIDDTRMDTWSVQSGRRQILEDMVDGRTPMGQGTTLDSNDQEYMQAYKDYKRVDAVAKRYNQMIWLYNSTDKDNITKNRTLENIQNFVNDLKDTDPQTYSALQWDLDKIPEFISKGGTGKIPTATVAHPAEAKQSTPAPINSVKSKVEIAPATNNNIPNPTKWNPAWNTPDTLGTPKEEDRWWQAIPIASNPTPTPKKNSGGYVKEEPETRYGYSSNSISQW